MQIPEMCYIGSFEMIMERTCVEKQVFMESFNINLTLVKQSRGENP